MNIAWGRGARLELQADGGELYRSVEQALKSFTKTERLDGDNGYKCDVCKRMFRVTKHVRQFKVRHTLCYRSLMTYL